jgi:hypothetical protein
MLRLRRGLSSRGGEEPVGRMRRARGQSWRGQWLEDGKAATMHNCPVRHTRSGANKTLAVSRTQLPIRPGDD